MKNKGQLYILLLLAVSGILPFLILNHTTAFTPTTVTSTTVTPITATAIRTTPPTSTPTVKGNSNDKGDDHTPPDNTPNNIPNNAPNNTPDNSINNAQDNAPTAVTRPPRTVSVPMRDIQRFATAIAQIKRYYIKDVDDRKLFDNAIHGMLNRLDPHSSYLDAQELKELQTMTSGVFGGIGIEIIPENGLIKVISPIDDTPSQRAGIKPNDLIININGKFIKDMNLREVVDEIRGKPGTQLKLTIVRKDVKKPLTFVITREVIKIRTVKSDMLEPGYGYIRIVFFQSPAKKELAEAIQKLQTQAGGRLKGLILDLRNNPGGLLEAAIDTTNLFLDANSLKYDKLIVYTKGRAPGSDLRAYAKSGAIFPTTPMVVLINGGSASASEIVAGALQDHKRAIIMGTKSFGKGSVQTVIPIDEESGIKLTTALYYTPAGNSIQAKGIQPDIIVADIKIPPEKTEELLESINEASLSHHLAEDGKGNNVLEAKKQEQKAEIALAHKDYQIYEALMLLKGLHTIQK